MIVGDAKLGANAEENTELGDAAQMQMTFVELSRESFVQFLDCFANNFRHGNSF